MPVEPAPAPPLAWRSLAADATAVALPGTLAALLLELVRPGAVSSLVHPALLLALLVLVAAAASRAAAPPLPRGYAAFVATLVGAILAAAVEAGLLERVLIGSAAAFIVALAARAYRSAP
jgi:hypothetical protein